jgi:ribosomal protein S18 acetylase RimI-like enzyme
MPEIKASPRNRYIGLLADALQAGKSGLDNVQLPVIGGLGSLLMGEYPELINDVAYYGPQALVKGGNAATGGLGTFRPDPRVLDLAGAVAGAPGAGRLAKTAANPLTYRDAFYQAMGPGVMSNAITPETAPLLAAMTKEQFLGKPKIVGKSDAKDLRPIQIKSLENMPEEPFLGGKYQAKYAPNGAVVLDNGKPIASYTFGDTLVVAPKYRKQGIGEELVYQQRTYFPGEAKASTRNKVSQKIQENVYNRIQNDLSGLLSD